MTHSFSLDELPESFSIDECLIAICAKVAADEASTLVGLKSGIGALSMRF